MSYSLLKTEIGKPLTEMFRILVPGDFPNLFYDKLVSEFRKIYATESKSKLSTFKGIRSTLDTMYKRNIKLTIASSKKASVIYDNCEALNISDYFHLILGADSVKNQKPHPEMIDVSLNKLGIKNRYSVLVVGDSTFDIVMGNAAGVDTCAVTWGVHSRNLLLSSKPTYIVDNIIDLSKFI